MKIKEVDLFDLYGNGTLVMKTKVDNESSGIRFCWYVKEKGNVIYKGTFQRNSFSSFQLPHVGKYTIKAFVKDALGEKDEMEVEFVANKSTSPDLDLGTISENTDIFPLVEHVSGGFWHFCVEGEVSQGSKYAWYVYMKDIEEPIECIMYSSSASYMYKFNSSGTYYVKLFVITNGVKKSIASDYFKVVV